MNYDSMNDIKGVTAGTDQTYASWVRSFVCVHFLLFSVEGNWTVCWRKLDDLLKETGWSI